MDDCYDLFEALLARGCCDVEVADVEVALNHTSPGAGHLVRLQGDNLVSHGRQHAGDPTRVVRFGVVLDERGGHGPGQRAEVATTEQRRGRELGSEAGHGHPPAHQIPTYLQYSGGAERHQKGRLAGFHHKCPGIEFDVR